MKETARLSLESRRTILDALSRFSRRPSISASFDSNQETRPALWEVTKRPHKETLVGTKLLGRGLPRVRECARSTVDAATHSRRHIGIYRGEVRSKKKKDEVNQSRQRRDDKLSILTKMRGDEEVP